jgi:hypothetical protein
MIEAAPTPADNLITLNLSPFSRADIAKIAALGDKQRLLYRWFRSERVSEAGLDRCFLYSGARGRAPYASYLVERHRNGRYRLVDQRKDEAICRVRTLDEVLDALPEDFYYSH